MAWHYANGSDAIPRPSAKDLRQNRSATVENQPGGRPLHLAGGQATVPWGFGAGDDRAGPGPGPGTFEWDQSARGRGPPDDLPEVPGEGPATALRLGRGPGRGS